MKLIRFVSVLLFWGLLFVLPVVADAKAETFEVRRGSDPPFVCKEVSQPKKECEIKKNILGLGLGPKEEYYGGAEENQKTLVLFVRFSDSKVSDDTSGFEKEAEESIVTGQNSVTNYLQEVSDGVMQKITLDILSGWVELPETSEKYGSNDPYEFDGASVFNGVLSAIDDKVKLSEFARVVIFMEGNHGFAMASQGKWGLIETDEGELSLSICWFWTDDITDQHRLRHEFLHTLGARHDGSIVLKDNDDCDRLCPIQDITKGEDGEWPPVKCTSYEYWHQWSIMGTGKYPSMWLKQKLWPNESQVYTPKESGIVRLIPRSSSSEGFKMLSFEGKDAQGSKIIIGGEYLKEVEGTFDEVGNGITSTVFLYFSDEDGNFNGDNTIMFREEIEKEGETAYPPLDLKEESFCDSRNGIKIELLGEYEDYAEIQITLDKPASTPTPTLIPLPSLTPIPTPTPILTPTPSPTLPPIPTPSPTPTPTPKEMTLLVSINGVDASNNNIVVTRGSRVTISVRAEIFDGFFWEDLQADKITCQIKNPRGKVKFSEERENTYEGSFSYKIKKRALRGFYEVEVKVLKKGYTTSFQQVSFKVR